MKKVLLPRVITANRGDLASRYLLLETLAAYPDVSPVVFRRAAQDIPAMPRGQHFPYGSVRNLFPPRASWQAWRQAKEVLWAVGIDLQDESSLAKLLYLWVMFAWFRLNGKRVRVLFQGAGPLRTRTGRWLARRVLDWVHVFVARDPKTARLVADLAPEKDVLLGHDAIFLPGKARAVAPLATDDAAINALFATSAPVIGVNVRLWFHLHSSVIPYQFARQRHLRRASAQMQVLLERMAAVIKRLREDHHARIVLVSAYEPNIEPWEDDLPWLQTIKREWFAEDDEVVVFDKALTMPAYFSLMSRFSLVVSMRLHTSLIALRFGVPAVNISYTTKGDAIMRHLGLAENVFPLDEFLRSGDAVMTRVATILAQREAEAARVHARVTRAIAENTRILESILEDVR